MLGSPSHAGTSVSRRERGAGGLDSCVLELAAATLARVRMFKLEVYES